MAELFVLQTNVKPDGSASATDTSAVFSLQAYETPISFIIRVKTAFVGLTNPTFALGVTGETEKFALAQPIDKVGGLVPGKMTDSQAGYCTKLNYSISTTARLPIIGTLTSDSTDLSGLSAGELVVIMVAVREKSDKREQTTHLR